MGTLPHALVLEMLGQAVVLESLEGISAIERKRRILLVAMTRSYFTRFVSGRRLGRADLCARPQVGNRKCLSAFLLHADFQQHQSC